MADPPTTAALSGLSPDERRLVEALRNRDEDAFAELIDRYHESLVRLAMMYVASRAVAEDVAQEAWVGCCAASTAFTAARRFAPGSTGSSSTRPRRGACARREGCRSLRLAATASLSSIPTGSCPPVTATAPAAGC